MNKYKVVTEYITKTIKAGFCRFEDPHYVFYNKTSSSVHRGRNWTIIDNDTLVVASIHKSELKELYLEQV